MSTDFVVGVLWGIGASAGVWVGVGYERLRLVVAKRSATKPAAVEPDGVVAVS